MFCKIKPVIGDVTEKEKETILFAAKELSRYFGLVDKAGDFPVIPTERYKESEESTLFLVAGHPSLPQVAETSLDDAVFIDVKKLCGTISGTNARAVLIAAYRFLRELGYSFVKPGKVGEELPDVLSQKAVSVCETPSYRHRGICIEGSVFYEGLIALLDWMPKAGMNSYFIQFMSPDAFYNNYYNRQEQRIQKSEMPAMTELIKTEIAKRSLLYHAVGHGWTCETMGIDSNSWDQYHEAITEEQKSIMAEIDGKRDLFNKQPLLTNLCYSNPHVQEKMMDTVLAYCKAHSEVDYLHVWLADGGRNNCECTACSGHRTADFYINMLNLLDEKLEKNGLNTRIVFLIYNILLWAPLQERFANHKRFVMMFAPASRSFTQPLDKAMATQVPLYPKNKDTYYTGTGAYLAALADWQRIVPGVDSFNFDYHFIFGSIYERTGYGLAETLHKDLERLHDLGLNGLMSCQLQHIFFPTALGMNVLSENLWNSSIPFETIVEKTYTVQFGKEHWKTVWDYMRALYEQSTDVAIREYFDTGWVEHPDDPRSEPNKAKMRKAVELVDAFSARYSAMVESMPAGNRRQNWEALLFGAELVKMIYLYYLAETKETEQTLSEAMETMLREKEKQFKMELDAGNFRFLKMLVTSTSCQQQAETKTGGIVDGVIVQ
ncbi:MAG: DUF4838 domain-containing protein [Ruminococcaceae bacterium]|nr:DUF4838 domain-containing protein [Oscillospiraceae bacterium]